MLDHNLQLANCLLLIKMIMTVWSDLYQDIQNKICLSKIHTVQYYVVAMQSSPLASVILYSYCYLQSHFKCQLFFYCYLVTLIWYFQQHLRTYAYKVNFIKGMADLEKISVVYQSVTISIYFVLQLILMISKEFFRKCCSVLFLV